MYDNKYSTICFQTMTLVQVTYLLIVILGVSSGANRVTKFGKLCREGVSDFRVEQRREQFVLFNYVKAKKSFACHESVTLTTHSDFVYLVNVPVLQALWSDGPISVALFAPGDDFFAALKTIAFLRNCEKNEIRSFVTFHVFFPERHFPKITNVSLVGLYKDSYDCDLGPPYANLSPNSLYKNKFNLTYPINVARNVAREAATTHYIFASDIELYPTPNLIEKFLYMINSKKDVQFKRKFPRVFALPVFEINEDQPVPRNKTHLQEMLADGKAILFHKNLCAPCHAIPKLSQWIQAKETAGLHIFTVGKRIGAHRLWEAFYIGQNSDPLFDERLTWEGQSNKMTQAYSMCLLNYDYMVLDNAFLVHRPGIKKAKLQLQKYSGLVRATNRLLKTVIKPQLIQLYGYRRECYL